MTGLRNPFRLRRSESIDTEDAFLALFEPGILDVMPQETLWDSVHIIRSAAGGGKTSLIRLFTPASLNALWRLGQADKTRELFQRMRDFGAIDDNGPNVLCTLLTCGPGYSLLQDLPVDQSRKTLFFFGLLNARITLAVLRGVLTLKGLPFPQGLDHVTVVSSKGMPSLQPLSFPCTGEQLFRWAEEREATLCGSLDSLGPLRADALRGDDALYALSLVEPGNLTIDGRPVAGRVQLMMDDIHKLTSLQREILVRTIIEARSPVGVWIAERFEALSAQEMLSSGAEKGRDYGATIEIESYWRSSSRWKKFEELAMRVADRRIAVASDTILRPFQGCIEDSLTGLRWEQRFTEIAKLVAQRVRERYAGKERFKEWIRLREGVDDPSAQQKAIEWRKLEILIERELNKKQKGLFDEQPLGEEELGEKDDSSLANAAELFLAREFELPYYYGAGRLARLASLNIQQFLGLAGDVFEESAAAEVLRRSLALPPERQHAIVKDMARQLWDDIPKKVRHGRALRQFLESVGNFSNAYTYRPTAPNDPGVTGTAIRMSERAQLFEETAKRANANPGMVRLGETIASALAHNLLVAQLDYNCKQEKWMLLNLNRLLCAHFDLPLGYGLYKERPLKTLIQWLDRPYTDASEGELL